MLQAHAVQCESCGAALPLERPGAVVVCQFCGTSHHVAAPAQWAPPPTVSAPAVTDLHGRLLAGPPGTPVGQGQRFTPASLPVNDPASLTHGVWARAANASSTYGGSWSPDAVCGPPKVYPLYGDRAGAWAPLLRTTTVEWVEAHYDVSVPCRAVRVYETNEAGATFAVLVDDGRGEQLVWAGAPERVSESRVLEVALSPPRAVRRVRVYVANNLGSSWVEVDSIGLLAVSPLPEAQRAKPAARGCGPATVAVVTLAVLAAVVAVAILTRGGQATRAAPERPSATLPAGPLGFDAPPTAPAAVWASALVGRSSEFSATDNAAMHALGPPDVYPTFVDMPGAWASQRTDGGPEWIQVRFPAAVRARSLVWVETFNPGAVARVDVVLAQGVTATVFEGAVQSPGTRAVVWTLPFAAPLDITEVRVVLDTRRVPGWNEIDAIGLVPAGP